MPKGKPARLKRFELRLHNNINLKLHDVEVVKDDQRHLIHLFGNPFNISLIRDENSRVTAFSEQLGVFNLVDDIPEFMKRLLS